MLSWWQRPFFEAWVTYNRALTKTYIAKINTILCNSKNSQARAKKYLGLKKMTVAERCLGSFCGRVPGRP